MEFFNSARQDSLFLWNFGDNQTNQVQEPAHYYAFPGTYTVTLTVTSFSGCISTASRQVTVSPIPEAGFSTQPACVNTEYTFVDTSRISIGSITNWTWSLPDGTMLSGFAPVYTFADTGTLSVTLDVVSDIGCEASVTRDIRSILYRSPISTSIRSSEIRRSKSIFRTSHNSDKPIPGISATEQAVAR